MGGPGRSKGTQCKNMATKYGFCLMGLGQLLQQEAHSSPQQGWAIQDIVLPGLLVPTVRAHEYTGRGKKGGTLGQTSWRGPMEADMPGRLRLLTGQCFATVSLCVLICKMGERLDPQQVCGEVCMTSFI